MTAVLNTESAAVPRSWIIRLSAIKASIGEISKPPIAGIIPLKAFKYGSVMEPTVLRMGLLQSRFGNQLNKTLTIRISE